MLSEELALVSNKINSYPENIEAITSPEDELKRGIWPRSLPLWMAAGYLSLFIIRPWEVLFPSWADIHLMKIYALCTIAVVFVSKKKRFHIELQTLTVLLFTFALTISALFAQPILFNFEWITLYEYLTLVTFYFILLLVIRTPYELVFMIICYIGIMAVYLAKSEWEYFVHGAHRYDPGTGIVRMCGIETTFGGPNSLAMSIVVSLPVLIFLWSFRKEITSGWPRFWRRWFPRFLVFYLVLAVSSTILTNSRSGMLSFVVFVFMVSLRKRSPGARIGALLLAFVVLVSIWVVMPEEHRNRFRSIWDPSAGTEIAKKDADARIEGLMTGIEMFQKFPLTGFGLGNFKVYRVREKGKWEQPHSLIGQVLGETGIIGGLTFSLMVIVLLAKCRKVRILGKRNNSDPKFRVLSALGVASRDAVILLCFEGLFGHNMMRFNWLWLAAFSSLALQLGSQQTQEMKSVSKPTN